MAPPMFACPSDRIVTKALRSSVSAMALRMSTLLNGGESRLTMRLVLTLVGATTQTAFGAWLLTSLSSGIDTSVGKVMSNLPAVKARIAVERFGMMVYSMPSR